MQTQIAEQRQGFDGAMLGLPLADILQLKQQNRFSGCIGVNNGGHRGRLFFRNGTIIHAELPNCEGEEACYRMLSWSGGRFQVDDKVDTTCHTIDKPLSFLLLEACRLIDENQTEQKEPPAKVSVGSEPSGYIASVLDTFKQIPEVSGAVVTNRNGQLLFAASDEEKKLATDGEFLSLVGCRIGQLLSLGELQLAACESQHQQIISVRNRRQSLYLAFCIGQPLMSVLDTVCSTLKSLNKT